MIHIVFEEANIALLQAVLAEEESLAGEVLKIGDDFAVGPVAGLDSPEGYQARRDWWETVLADSPYAGELALNEDKLLVHRLQQRLTAEAETEVWIWMGQNAHDVCSYYWFMSQFKDFAGRLQVLYLNNLPFFNEKGQIFYPTHLHQISPKELRKARKLARPITLSEFEVDPDEWKKHALENAHVRLLEGGKKLVGKDWEVLDKVILAQLNKEAVKLNKFLGQVMAKLQHPTSDAVLVWRLRELAAAEKLVIQGDASKGWKDLSITTNAQHG